MAQGDGELISPPMLLPAHTLPSLPLLQCGVPPTEESPLWTAPMWVLMDCSYSSTAPAWVLSSWYISSGVAFSSMGSPQDYRSCQKISSVDSSAWATVSARELLCHGLPMGCTAHPPILVSSTVGISAPLWSSPWASGDSLLPHLEHPFHPYFLSGAAQHLLPFLKLSQRYHQSCW